METTGVIASSAMDGLLASIELGGCDMGRVSARIGLGSAVLFSAGDFTPLAAFTSTLEVASEEENDPLLGLRLAREFKFEALGAVAAVFMTAPTLGDALMQFSRFFAAVQSKSRSELTVENDLARFSYAINDHTVRHKTQDAVFTEGVMNRMCSAAIGDAWKPACIEFEHAPGELVAQYRSHFACPVAFGRRDNAIIFPKALLEHPLASHDENHHLAIACELSFAMTRRENSLDLVAALKAWISASLCQHSRTDLEDAAGDFGMSLRSFQRKLAEHGVKYADLRNIVKMEIAKSLLIGTRLSIPMISDQLGYSELSAFARSFRNVTGTTPARFRERMQWRPNS